MLICTNLNETCHPECSKPSSIACPIEIRNQYSEIRLERLITLAEDDDDLAEMASNDAIEIIENQTGLTAEQIREALLVS